MKKITALFISVLACSSTGAQNTFQKAFGGALTEIGTCIQHTPDGNYIISGYSASFSTPFRDAYLLKTDTAGNLLWSKTYGGSNDETCYYVSVCDDGGFILTGTTTSFGSGQNDVYLIRTDAAGNVLWSAVAGGAYQDNGSYVVQTPDRGFLVSGYSETCFGGCTQGMLVKTDSTGTVQWTKLLGGSGVEGLYGLALTTDGGSVVTGAISTNSFGSSDTWLVKLDANGDTAWTKYYGSPGEESGAAVRQTSDGGYIITGDIHNAFNVHHASLLKTDSLGNLQWAKTFGAPDSSGGEFGWDVHQLSDHGYVLAGTTPAFNNSQQIFVVRTDSTGSMLWSKVYGGPQAEDTWYCLPAADGGLAILGATQSFGSGQWDIYLLKTDSTGFTNACNDSSIVPEEVNPVLQTGSGTIITTGMPSSNPVMIANNPVTLAVNICPPVAVAENNFNERDVSVYPNPFSTSLTVKLNTRLKIRNAEFRICDVLGREVHTSQLSAPESKIDTGSLPSGIYFYKVTGDNVQGIGTIIEAGKIVAE